MIFSKKKRKEQDLKQSKLVKESQEQSDKKQKNSKKNQVRPKTVKIIGGTEHISVGMSTICGDRKYQQDKGLLQEWENRIAAVICDGMGGLSGGEIASEQAANRFIEDLEGIDWNEEFPHFFQKEMNRLDEGVVNLKDVQGEPLRAGTTLAAVMVEDDRFWYISVGDSRIYHLRGDELRCLTTDHNYQLILKEYLQEGYISEEEFQREIVKPKAQALISYLGMGKEKRMDYCEEPLVLEKGDKLILCSDGLYKTLYEKQIQAIAQEECEDAKQTAERLLQVAVRCAAGDQDNTTVIVIEHR